MAGQPDPTRIGPAPDPAPDPLRVRPDGHQDTGAERIRAPRGDPLGAEEPN